MFLNNIGARVKDLMRVRNTRIDGPIFNLHCQLTSLMLLFACTIILLQQYSADNGGIQCMVDSFKNDGSASKEDIKVAQTFCLVQSTFTLIPNKTDGYSRNENQKIYHTYYQWVSSVLFLQAAVFYIPKWLWQQLENQLMRQLRGTDYGQQIKEDEMVELKDSLVNYFVLRLNFQVHRRYVITYWLLEFLCLVNTIGQVLFVNKFLNGNFLSYGLAVFNLIEFSPRYTDQNFTTMDYVFPTVTKCIFRKYGQAGSIQMLDASCILVLNTYNRYIFLVMWYYFLLLILLLALVLFYRLACLLAPELRYIHLRTTRRKYFNREARFLARNLSVGEWWVLYSLKSNLNADLYEDIVVGLSEKLRVHID